MTLKSNRSALIVKYLGAEHAEIRKKHKKLDNILTNFRYEGKSSLDKNVKQACEVLVFFRTVVCRHMEVEEKILFPFLEKHVPKLELPIATFRSEHNDFREILPYFQSLLRRVIIEQEHTWISRGIIDDIIDTGLYINYLLIQHLHTENETIYEAIKHVLNDDEKEVLWKRIEQVKQPERLTELHI